MQSRNQKRRKIEVSSIGSVPVVETQNLVTQAQDTQNPVNNLLQSSTMVINQRQGIMFICYYNPATLTLIFVEPIKILKNNDTLMNDLIQQFNPEVIVCTSKVMALLGLDPNDLDLKIEVKPSKDFNIIDGELFIDSFERGLRRKDQIVLVRKLQNFISQLRISDDFTQYLTLLSIISTNIEMACEEHNQINKTDLINVMEFVPLNGYLYIDSDSMVSLKIKMNTSFEKEESLLKLFGKCFSKIGNSLLQEWLMRPLIDKGKIESRHVAIRKITKEYEIGNKQSIVRQLTDCIGGISDINGIIQKLRVGSYDGAIWKQIKSILYNLIKMKELIDNSEYLKDTECFVKFIESFDVGNLYRLNQILVSVIDFETDVDNICIKPNFDNTLQNYKTLYDEMEQILSEKAFELRNQLNIEAVIAYIPQFGYLVAIDKDQPIQSLEQNFDLVFTTATTFYYKNNSMTEMDENYGDLYSLIRDREIEILYNLQNKLFDYGLQNLTTVYQHIGEIDVLICFALVSIKNNFTKPVLVTEEHGVLELKDSFHPLIQSSNFITNNFEVTESKVIVVTGPNYSGKSTLMTQIGITIYLSQIGCYIPAQSGKLSIFKNILTRINTLESVNSNQSTFMKDCQQMSKCLSKATKDSLILIDEFGKGTDINDGPGLLGSILKFYIEQDENTPLVILTSHMTELFTREMLGELIDKIDFKQMTIYIENENLFKMTFLYQVAPGMTTTSAGLYCAKKSGIDQKVIEKAQFILNLIKQGQNIVSEFATLDESEMLMIGEHRNKIKKFLKLNFQDWPLKEQSKLKHEVLSILNS